MREIKGSFLDTKDYLPDFLKDFHDQKDFFKAMHDLYSGRLDDELPAFNWRDSHIYTIDFFLWFLGYHGYKIQKARTKGVQFCDLKETIKHFKDKRTKSAVQLLNSDKNDETSVATEAQSKDEPLTQKSLTESELRHKFFKEWRFNDSRNVEMIWDWFKPYLKTPIK